jgi:hypothetical protein
MIKEFSENLNQDFVAQLTHSSTTTIPTAQPQQKLKTATNTKYPSILEQSCSLTIRMCRKQRINNLNGSIFCTRHMKCQPTVFSFFLRACKQTVKFCDFNNNEWEKAFDTNPNHYLTTIQQQTVRKQTSDPQHIHPRTVMQPHHQDTQQAAQ